MDRVDFAALVGGFAAVGVSGYAAWKVGFWFGDFTYQRWNNRRLNRA